MNRRELVARLARHAPRRSMGVVLTRREGGEYEVTYVDDLGHERSRIFATRGEARRYRTRVAESLRMETATLDNNFRTYDGGTGSGGAL